jgi:GTPase SAR1 family protein
MTLDNIKPATMKTEGFLNFFEYARTIKHQDIACTETHVVFVGDQGCGKTSLINQTLGTSQSRKGRLIFHHPEINSFINLKYCTESFAASMPSKPMTTLQYQCAKRFRPGSKKSVKEIAHIWELGMCTF